MTERLWHILRNYRAEKNQAHSRKRLAPLFIRENAEVQVI